MDLHNSSQNEKAVKTERDSPSHIEFKINSPKFVLRNRKKKKLSAAQAFFVRNRHIIPYGCGRWSWNQPSPFLRIISYILCTRYLVLGMHRTRVHNDACGARNVLWPLAFATQLFCLRASRAATSRTGRVFYCATTLLAYICLQVANCATSIWWAPCPLHALFYFTSSSGAPCVLEPLFQEMVEPFCALILNKMVEAFVRWYWMNVRTSKCFLYYRTNRCLLMPVYVPFFCFSYTILIRFFGTTKVKYLEFSVWGAISLSFDRFFILTQVLKIHFLAFCWTFWKQKPEFLVWVLFFVPDLV